MEACRSIPEPEESAAFEGAADFGGAFAAGADAAALGFFAGAPAFFAGAAGFFLAGVAGCALAFLRSETEYPDFSRLICVYSLLPAPVCVSANMPYP